MDRGFGHHMFSVHIYIQLHYTAMVLLTWPLIFYTQVILIRIVHIIQVVHIMSLGTCVTASTH